MNDIRINKTEYMPIVDFGYVSVVRGKDYTFEYRKGKARYSFVYVKKGALKYDFKNTSGEFYVNEGEIIYIPIGIPLKATYLREETEICILLFQFDKMPLPDYIKNPTLLGKNNVFCEITPENRENGFFLSSSVNRLLYVLQEKQNTEDIPKKYEAIYPALERIKSRFNENLPIKVYSDLCAMSESNFRRLFKEYIGMSPIEYRNAIRIKEYKNRLASGEFLINEIAYDIGFRNMSFFYETLRKYKNDTKYAKQITTDDE